MKKLCVFVSCMLCMATFHGRLVAQSLPSVVNVTTPEVTAFKHDFEVPVSLYSGVPNISIPLYEIKMNGVSVPITLNYHAGGIRADQEATWVGLGWSLDYGGMISRKIKGAPDEDFFIRAANTSDDIDHFNQLPLSSGNFQTDLDTRMNYIKSAKNNSRDYMPDEFYFSALGYSGKCMFNQNQNKFILFPHEDISIRQFKSGLIPLYSWNVILPNGISVDFGKDAYTAQNTNIKNIKSSWQIKTIRGLYKDSLTYEYEPFTYETYQLSGVSSTYYAAFAGAPAVPTPQSAQASFPKVVNTDSRLMRITFPGGTVEFEVVDRLDMAGKALRNVIVKNEAGKVLRKITLLTSYFVGSKFDMLPSQNSIVASKLGPDTYRYNRLRLDGLEIYDTNNIAIQRYNFDYYTNSDLPSKYNFSQDHWGYYNGAANTAAGSFIPNIGYGGGNRAVDTAYSQLFSLKNIKYPEGGQTRFSYEGNTAQISTAPKELLQQYQDKNIPTITQALTASGWSRRGYGTPPDSTGTTGEVFYIKRFTVPVNALMPPGYGLEFYTNYGISDLEKYTPYSADNCEFRLSRVNSNGSKELIRSFNTTEVNPKSDGTYQRNGQLNSYLALLPGNYEMQVRLMYLNNIGSPAENQPFNLWCYVRYRQPDANKPELFVGGLRVKKIEYLDSDGTLKKSKQFRYVNPNYPATPNLTSGRVVSLPSYFKRGYQMIWNGNQVTGSNVSITFSSNSVLPLETTSGSYAGYEYVDEIDVDGSGNEMKTSYQYSFNPPYFYNLSYPFMSLRAYEPKEWTNGKMLYKKFYKGNNIIKQEDYTYYDWSPHLSNLDDEEYVQEINTDLISQAYLATADGYTAPYDFYDGSPSITTIYDAHFGQNECINFTYGAGTSSYSPSVAGVPVWTCNPMSIQVPYFKHYSGFDKLKRKVITSFEGSNALITEENYSYNKTPVLYQLSQSYSLTSKGDTLKTKFKYPTDSTSLTVYDKMVKRHILTPVIEQANYKNSQVLSLSNIIYKQWPADTSVLAPEREISKIGTGPYFAKVKYIDYDAKGNILGASRESGAVTAYLWAYKKRYPVASVNNAAIKDVYYEGFEEWTGSGLSTENDAKTGKFSRTSGLSQTLTGLTPGKYTLTYWRKSGGNWSYNLTDNIQVNGSYTITLTGQVDEIRFYPKDALITTYTYEPHIGITSITDPKGEVSFYEYDEFNRLKNIKDAEGNILKNYCYNYAGQQTGCPIITTLSQNVPVTYQNWTGTTAKVNQLKVKDAGGTVLYTFSTTNLQAGVTIPRGTYTFEFSMPTTEWIMLGVTLTDPVYLETYNNGSTTYTLSNVDLSNTTSVNINLWNAYARSAGATGNGEMPVESQETTNEGADVKTEGGN